MKKVTQKELAQILLNTKVVKGMPMIATVLQLTKPKANKTDRVTKEENPHTEILKFSKVSIILNTDYNRAVEKQLLKEDKDPTDHKKGKNTMVITFGLLVKSNWNWAMATPVYGRVEAMNKRISGLTLSVNLWEL